MANDKIEITDELLAALRGVKRGSCFCEVSCDNPMMGGKHTKECIFAMAVLDRHDASHHCMAEQEDRGRMIVTREMAIDAGDPSLEGTL